MIRVRTFAIEPYPSLYEKMLGFTKNRTAHTADELWFLQHTPVFTQGQAGKQEHVLFPGEIPVIQTDRGGQVTYHGPGQLVVYLLLDIKRLGIGARVLVSAIEQALVHTLAQWHITAGIKADSPGVYVGDKKIASLGLRIKNGCSFHGLALNVDMDLEPFQRINPCGYTDMEMTKITNETTKSVVFEQVAEALQIQLFKELVRLGASHE